jgi:hypothetical protein
MKSSDTKSRNRVSCARAIRQVEQGWTLGLASAWSMSGRPYGTGARSSWSRQRSPPQATSTCATRRAGRSRYTPRPRSTRASRAQSLGRIRLQFYLILCHTGQDYGMGGGRQVRLLQGVLGGPAAGEAGPVEEEQLRGGRPPLTCLSPLCFHVPLVCRRRCPSSTRQRRQRGRRGRRQKPQKGRWKYLPVHHDVPPRGVLHAQVQQVIIRVPQRVDHSGVDATCELLVEAERGTLIL